MRNGLYYWKDITCGRICFKKVNSNNVNQKHGISGVKYEIIKTDTSESDMKQLIDFLSNTQKDEFPTCKKYLANNPYVLLKWYQINTDQGGDNIAQWVAWTEMSLNEIDTYNY